LWFGDSLHKNAYNLISSIHNYLYTRVSLDRRIVCMLQCLFQNSSPLTRTQALSCTNNSVCLSQILRTFVLHTSQTEFVLVSFMYNAERGRTWISLLKSGVNPMTWRSWHELNSSTGFFSTFCFLSQT